MSHAGRTDPEGVAKHAEEMAAAKAAKPAKVEKPAAKPEKKPRSRAAKTDDE